MKTRVLHSIHNYDLKYIRLEISEGDYKKNSISDAYNCI